MAVPLIGTETVTHRRYGSSPTVDANGYVSSYPVDATESRLVSFQQPRPETLQVLSEGDRSRDPREFVDRSEVLTAIRDGRPADEYVRADGSIYRVIEAHEQPAPLGHWEGVAVRYSEMEEPSNGG